jgi:hypothetical protein
MCESEARAQPANSALECLENPEGSCGELARLAKVEFDIPESAPVVQNVELDLGDAFRNRADFARKQAKISAHGREHRAHSFKPDR